MGTAWTWLRHRLESGALNGSLGLIERVDLETALQWGRTLARLGRRVLRHEWGWAMRNLELVFGPALDVAERRRLAALAFEHHFMSYLEGARTKEIKLEVPPEVDPMVEAWREGRGVICCTVHLGSWEPTLAFAASAGLPVAAVYREATNPLSEQAFSRVRAAYGVEWIPRGRLVEAARALRRGKVLMVMTDVNTASGGLTADFLGIPAQCPTLAAKFALRCGSPIVPGVAVRERPGLARLLVGDVIRPESVADEADPAAALTRRLNAAVEPWVLEFAEQYNWLHPRWRTRPDGRTWTLRESAAAQQAERVAPFAAVPARVRALIGASP